MKSFFVLVFTLFFLIPLLSQVDEEELETVDPDSIQFINYEGPYTHIDTVEEIVGIGRYLGKTIKDGQEHATYSNRFSILHRMDPDSAKLSADIFIVHENSAVDHVLNMRRILAGYLEIRYGYSLNQAMVLARFITVYNAVYRSNMNYFSGLYHEGVIQELSETKAGMSRIFSDWPGKTQILIPLTAKAGTETVKDLDTDVLTDPEVIESLRKEEDRGIDDRQVMVDIKEEEIEEDLRVVEERREEIADREDIVRETQEELAREKEIVDDKIRDVQKLEDELEDLIDTDADPDTIAEKEADLQRERDAAAREAEDLDEKQAALDQERRQLEEDRKAVDDDEAAVVDRIEAMQKEREDIAKDIEEVTEVQAAIEDARIVVFLQSREVSGDILGQIVSVNTATQRIEKASPVNTIRSRSLVMYGNKILAIAGESTGNRTVSLVLLDSESLDLEKSGTVAVYPHAPLLVNRNNIYTVILENSQYYIGQFDENLNLVQRSTEAIAPFSALSLEEGMIFAQDPVSGILILNISNLQRRKDNE